jgi:GntR family transcriptional repressor for pyruvate dehydrogenase complex
MTNGPEQANIDHFREIEFKSPSDLIIRQIRELLSGGVLKPGDRLPSERELAAKFSVGRGHIRKALQKLEFYGILETQPQHGTVVSGLGVKSLEGLISNMLRLERDDFASLIETRRILETQAAALAAERRLPEDLAAIREAHEDFSRQVERESEGLEEDLMFHLKIAEASGNSILSSLIGLITPDIIQLSRDLHTCEQGRFKEAFQEHERILRAIEAHDAEEAETAMREHMSNTRVPT